MNSGSLDLVASPSHKRFGADASDNDTDSRSNNSNDDLSESESNLTKKVKVVAAAATIDMTFDFGSSTIGKSWIWMMEGLGYFAKGPAQALA
jgi:hypothetical protein